MASGLRSLPFLRRFLRVYELRDPADLAFRIHAGQDTGPLRQEQAGAPPGEPVRMLDLARRNVGAGGFQQQFFIVEGGPAKLDAHLGDHEENSLGLKIPVGDAVGAEQLCPPHLEPDRVHAVVDHAALVRLRISRGDCNRMALHC